jgi:hypothetical protein
VYVCLPFVVILDRTLYLYTFIIDLLTLHTIYVLRISLVCGRKFILSPKIKGPVLEMCLLYDTLVLVLIVVPLLR